MNFDCKNNDITRYLEQCGSTLKGSYWTSPFSKSAKHSISVFQARNGNVLWKCHATGESGGLNRLIEFSGIPFNSQFKPTVDFKASSSSNEVLCDYNLSNPRNVSYLENRGLSIPVCQAYLRQVKYRNQKGEFWGVAWKNNKNGWEIVSPTADFKAIKTCTNKAPTVINGAETSTVMVFEGMFDLLAYLTDKQTDLKGAVIVLNSWNMVNSIDWTIFNTIYFLGDNDSCGDKAIQVIRQQNQNTKDMRTIYKGFLDYNDYLKAKTTGE